MEDPEAQNLITHQTQPKQKGYSKTEDQNEHDLSLVRQMWEVTKAVVPKTSTALLFQAPLVIDLIYAGHFDD